MLGFLRVDLWEWRLVVPGTRARDIAIVGGGAAAWLAAATLSQSDDRDFCRIRVIHPPRRRVGPISEVALPSFHRLNGLLGIDEDDLVRRTLGTFRLGERFKDWGRVGDGYFHAFGPLGVKLDAVPFQHYWLKLRQSGENTAIEHYSVAAMAAHLCRFAHPALDRNSVLSFYSYGYHFDAGLLESYLEKYALAHGVVRVDGEVVEVQLDGEDGLSMHCNSRTARAFARICISTPPASRVSCIAGCSPGASKIGVICCHAIAPSWLAARVPARFRLTRSRALAAPGGSGAFRCSTALITAMPTAAPT